MMTRIRWQAIKVAVFGAAVALAGCGPVSSEGGTVTPVQPVERAGPEAMGPHDGEDVGELRLRLEKLRSQQLEITASAQGDPAVCEDLCSLATSICGVKEKLCNLADDHPGDDGYQNLCREARQECGEAQGSCVSCVEQHRR